ncbi:MAG: hypothetical protein RSD95_14375, partial [Clostridia bacterium]
DAMQSNLPTPDGGTVNVSKKVVIKGRTAGVRIGGLTKDGADKFRNATIDWKAASGVKQFKAAPNLLIVYGYASTEGTSIGFTVTERDDAKNPANFFARSSGETWDVGEAKKCLIPDQAADKDTPILRTEAIYWPNLAKYQAQYLAFPKKGADGDFIVYGNNNKDYATSSFYEAVCAATGTLSDDKDRKINCQDTTSTNPAYIVMNADGTLPSGKAFVVGAGKVQVVSTKKACTLTLIENLQVGSYVGGVSTKGELTFGGDATALGITGSVINVAGTANKVACAQVGTLTLHGGSLTGHTIKVGETMPYEAGTQTTLNLNNTNVEMVEVSAVAGKVNIHGGHIGALYMPSGTPDTNRSEVYLEGTSTIDTIWLTTGKAMPIYLSGNADLTAKVNYIATEWVDRDVVLTQKPLTDPKYTLTGNITLDTSSSGYVPYWCIKMDDSGCMAWKVRVRAGADANNLKPYASLGDAWKAAVAAGGNYTFHIAPDSDNPSDSANADVASIRETLTVPQGLHYTLRSAKYTVEGGTVQEVVPSTMRLLKRYSSFTSGCMIDAQGSLTLDNVVVLDDSNSTETLKLGGTLTLAKTSYVQQVRLTNEAARVKLDKDYAVYPGDGNSKQIVRFTIPEGFWKGAATIDNFISAGDMIYEDRRNFSVAGLGADVWSLKWALDNMSARLVKEANVASVQEGTGTPVGYKSFEDALAACESLTGDVTLRLYGNVAIKARATIPSAPTTVTIMAAGKDIKICRGASYRGDLFLASSNLTLDAEEGYTLTLDGNSVNAYGALVEGEGDHVTINITERVTLKDNNSDVASLRMYKGVMAGTITGNEGGGVEVLSTSQSTGTVELSGTITNNVGTTFGGVKVDQNGITISGTVSGNKATEANVEGAGGVYVGPPANAKTITRAVSITGTVSNNTATAIEVGGARAGGVYVGGTGAVTIDGTVSGNTATATGKFGTCAGGVYVSQPEDTTTGGVTITGTVSGNVATVTGDNGAGAGGVYVSPTGTVAITGSVKDNTCAFSTGAGGVYAANKSSEINIAGGVNITGNTKGASPSNLRGKATATAAITGSVGFSMFSETDPLILTYDAGVITQENFTSGKLFADNSPRFAIAWTDTALSLNLAQGGAIVTGIPSLEGIRYFSVDKAWTAAKTALGDDKTTPFTIQLGENAAYGSSSLGLPLMTIDLNNFTLVLSVRGGCTLQGAVIGPGTVSGVKAATSSASFGENVAVACVDTPQWKIWVTSADKSKRYYLNQSAAFQGAKSGETIEIQPFDGGTGNLSIDTTEPVPAGVTLNIPAGKTLTLAKAATVNGTISGAGTLDLSTYTLDLGTTGQLDFTQGLSITATSTSGSKGCVKVAAGNKNALPLPLSRTGTDGSKYYFTSLACAKNISGLGNIVLQQNYTLGDGDATLCEWSASNKPAAWTMGLDLNGHTLTIAAIGGKMPFLYMEGASATVDLSQANSKIVNEGVLRAEKYEGAQAGDLEGTGLYGEDMVGGGDLLRSARPNATAEIHSSNPQGTRFFANTPKGAFDALTAQKSLEGSSSYTTSLKLLQGMDLPEGVTLATAYTLNLNGQTLTIPETMTYTNTALTTLEDTNTGGALVINGGYCGALTVQPSGTVKGTGWTDSEIPGVSYVAQTTSNYYFLSAEAVAPCVNKLLTQTTVDLTLNQSVTLTE